MQIVIYKHQLIPGIINVLNNGLFVRLIFFILITLWCIGFLSASIFPDSLYISIASPFIKNMYSLVCHQHVEKTFSINDHYLYVCARCTGIYLGAFVISLFSLFSLHNLPRKINLLYISAIPMLIDVVSTTAGIYSYSKTIALLTGIFFGSVVFVYILAALENNFMDKPL